MRKEEFVDYQFSMRGIRRGDEPDSLEDSQDLAGETEEGPVELTEESLFEEEYQSEPVVKGGIKSADFRVKEAAFRALYDAYMRPPRKLSPSQEKYLFEDMISLLRTINTDWVKFKAQRYQTANLKAEVEEPLQDACLGFAKALQADKLAGKYIDHALAHYISISRRKAIDYYYRPTFGRYIPQTEEKKSSKAQFTKRDSEVLHYEDFQRDEDGAYHDDRNPALSWDPFADIQRPVWERDDLTRQLAIIYLSNLMNYRDEPQKPIALMYGSCIYQLAKVSGATDLLSERAAKSTTVSSAEWAHQRMGNSTLRRLSVDSQKVVSEYYDYALSWGPVFLEHMEELTPDGKSFLWANIIYTQTYSKTQTSKWITSIRESAVSQAARIAVNNEKLVDYVLDTYGKKNIFRSALEDLVEGGRK